MADYKDKITGTVGTILHKAKEIAESDAVSGAVGKVREAAAGTGILEVYEKGTQRAKSFGSATKLTMDLNRDHRELNRVFSEIGKLYYEQAQNAPEGFFAPLFEQVGVLKETISAKEAEIAAYKASFESPEPAGGKSGLDGDIADFESIVSQTETDGTSF